MLEAQNILGTLEDIVYFIIYPEIVGWLLFLKILFLIISGLVIIFIIFVAVFRTNWLSWWLIWDWKEFFTLRPYGLKKLTKEWNKIKTKLEKTSESEYKLAIIEADNLLNKALRNLQIGLETLEESLRRRVGPDTISNIEEVKRAHQIRDNIVQDPDFKVSLEETKEILEIYEKALKHLNML